MFLLRHKIAERKLTCLFPLADGVQLFQADIIMTRDISRHLTSRGIVVPGEDISRLLPQGYGAKRPKRAIMRTNRGSDLRWPVGSSGKREVPYIINIHDCESIIQY